MNEDPIIWFANPHGTGGNPQSQWSGYLIDQSYSHDVRIADINEDGYWLCQPAVLGSGSGWQHRTIGAWGAGGSIDTADLDGDGRLDVLLAPSESGPGEIAWFEALADPLDGSWIRHSIADAEDVHLVHLDDFDLDIVSIAWDDFQTVQLWRNDAL